MVQDILDSLAQTVRENNQILSPCGTIALYAGNEAPHGWVFCHGAALAREAFPELFEVIGTTYGPGDDSSTFNLPNLPPLTPDIHYIIRLGKNTTP